LEGEVNVVVFAPEEEADGSGIEELKAQSGALEYAGERFCR